jgi:hypothetical protein
MAPPYTAPQRAAIAQFSSFTSQRESTAAKVRPIQTHTRLFPASRSLDGCPFRARPSHTLVAFRLVPKIILTFHLLVLETERVEFRAGC